VPLGCTSLTTPATTEAKKITQYLQSMLELVSDCHANTEVIQLALSSLTQVVKSMNQTIVSRSIQDKLSFFVGIKLTKRTNSMFTKLLGHWLVSDQLVEYFVFTLKGFDFLLDTISADHKPSSSTDAIEESKDAQSSDDESQMKGSDLENIFHKDAASMKPDASVIDTTTPASTQTAVAAALAAGTSDDVFVAPIMDLAKVKFIL
jgi:hypothetical protein